MSRPTPPAQRSSGSGSSSSPPTMFHLVSTTPSSGSPASSARGSSPLDGDSSDSSSSAPRRPWDRFRRTEDQSEKGQGGSDHWDGWLKSYSQGHWAGDAVPYPPPAISAVLDPTAAATPVHSKTTEEDHSSPSSSHATFSIYPESSSSNSGDSNAGSFQGDDDILEHYKKHGYLKAPKSAFEQQRLAILKRYKLDDKHRRANIDRVCRLAKVHYRTETIIVTLVFEGHSVVAAESGFDPSGVDPSLDDPVRPLPDLNISLCGHGMLKTTEPDQPREAFVVPDLSRDWRYKNNPQSLASGGNLAFYASSNINLPTLDTSAHVPSLLPVGSICVISDKPRASGDDFTSADRDFLHMCSDMIAREFHLGYQEKRRELETTQNTFLGRFLEKVLVRPLDDKAEGVEKASQSAAAPSTTAVRDEQLSKEEQKAQEEVSVVASSIQLAATQFLALTGATSAAILDLRSFRAPVPSTQAATRMGRDWDAAGLRSRASVVPTLPATRPPLVQDIIFEEDETSSVDGASQHEEGGEWCDRGQAEQWPPRAGDAPSPQEPVSRHISALGHAGDLDWAAITGHQQAALAHGVSEALLMYYETGRTEYGPGTSQLSPLGAVIPHGPTAIVPVFDDDVPSLLIIITSSDKLARFDDGDARFAQNVGSVLASAMLRERALAADRAKLAFVSQISHELRTPLHGVTSQLELIREFASPQQLMKLAPMLDVADCCVESLRDVLDDTLDYAKFSNSTPDQEASWSTLATSDLARLAEDVTKAVYVRKRRTDLVSVDTSWTSTNGKPRTPGTKVDVILEVTERAGGWNCWMDPGGLKRVLLNLLGNALKFTETGFVKLAVREGKPSHPSSRTTNVVIDVEDTGFGMTEDFIAHKLFLPFAQANPFASGAGLGMSITAQIVKRMSGTIEVISTVNKGTIFRVTLPLEFAPESVPASPTVDSGFSAGFPTPRATSSPTTPRQSLHQFAPRVSKRIISDELIALFNPLRLSATPFDERSTFDFGKAVDAAQSALNERQPLRRIPSSRRRRPTHERASPSDIADEVARLAFSEAASSPPPAPKQPLAFDLKPALGSSLLGRRTSPSAPATPLEAPFQPRAPVTEAPPRPPQIKVLFADDNPIARNILVKLFTGKSIAFTSTCDGVEACEAFEAAAAGGDAFHLFLVDMQMPRRDGLGAASAVREYEVSHNMPRCRIVALSGLDNEIDMQKAGVMSEDGPIDGWVTKGGKSLRSILQIVEEVQGDLTAEYEQREREGK